MRRPMVCLLKLLTTPRTEYHSKILTKLFNGNSLRACYALAITIFSLGLFRDALLVPPPPPLPS